jgi:hypothetical protein
VQGAALVRLLPTLRDGQFHHHEPDGFQQLNLAANPSAYMLKSLQLGFAARIRLVHDDETDHLGGSKGKKLYHSHTLQISNILPASVTLSKSAH